MKYVQALCDRERWRQLSGRGREEEDGRDGDGGGRGEEGGSGEEEHEAPPNSPKNNLQLWMNTLSQSNVNSVDVCVLRTVEC